MNLKDLASRGVITAKYPDGRLRSLQVLLIAEDVRDPIEHFEPYGFTAEPFAGAEVLTVSLGGDRDHTIALVTPDRRYRPVSLKDGEVCLYDDLGRKIYLSRDGITIEANGSPVTINASAGVTINGDVTVHGDVVADGISLKNHTHSGVEKGNSNTGEPQ